MPRLAQMLFAWWLCGQVLVAAAAASVWLDVPFVKQEKEGCGAASIAMVMQYWRAQQHEAPGSDTDPVRIQQNLYVSEAHGIYASQVESYFKEHGFQAFAFRGEWADLQEHLGKGRPLMVALKPGGGALHYVVIAGFEAEQGPALVLMNDPAQRKLLKQDRGSFEREWKAAGNWTLLALPRAEVH